jgi:hypothetical protein
VRLYSAANLTFGKDKLPALSGVARLGYNETGDQYLAGLWKEQLEEQLCWDRGGNLGAKASTMRPRPPWRAPTWSWASIDGEVSWYSRQKGVLDTTHVQVLDANTTKYGYDPFGQVTSGVIRFACPTMAAGYLVHPSEPNRPEPEGDAIILSYASNKELNVPIQIDCQDDSNSAPNKLFYLLPLLSGKTGSSRIQEDKSWTDELMIEGIVLKATGVTKGELSRVGSFKIYKGRIRNVGHEDEIHGETYEQFLNVLKKHGAGTAKEACAEVISNPEDVDKRYVITLV